MQDLNIFKRFHSLHIVNENTDSQTQHKYDMIIGRDLLRELGITLNFSDQTMTWDESTVRMKDPEEFADISSPLHEFFWHCECYETQALQDASVCLKKILDAKYAPADLDEIVRQCASD